MKGMSILVQTYAYRLKIKYLYLKIKGLTLSFRLCNFGHVMVHSEGLKVHTYRLMVCDKREIG
jgi:hypothetical protein